MLSLCIDLHAQDENASHDNAVAASILCKLAIYIEENSPDKETENSKRIEFILSDLEYFTETKRGEDLKKQGAELISLLITGSANPYNPIDPSTDAVNNPLMSQTPQEFAAYIGKKIKDFADFSEAPPWIYKLYEIEQDGTRQPATRPESESEGCDKPQPESEARPQ